MVLFSINVAWAQNICDPDCTVDFVFDSGGTIVAIDAMTFTFATASELNLGATGTVNTGVQPESLDFSAGGVLNLAAGESITFDANGFLSMAQGSNLDAISFSVTGGDLSISSASSVVLTGNIIIDGNFSIETQMIIITGDVVVDNDLSASSPGISGGVIISGTGNITVGSAGSTGSTGSAGSIIIDGSVIPNTSITLSINDLNQSETVDLGDGTLEPLDDLSILEGLEMTAQDGTLCTVSGDECVAENGDIYKLVDGELVKQEEGDGTLGLGVLLLVGASLVSRKYRMYQD